MKLSIIYIVFLLFSCNSSRENIQEKEKPSTIDRRSSPAFFLSGGVPKKLSIYSDKFSSRLSILGIKQGKDTHSAFHLEYTFTALSRNSLDESEKILGKKYPRFTIREKALIGIFSKNDRQGLLELNADTVLTRSWTDFDLDSLIGNLQKQEYSQFSIQEKILFKPKRNYQLWKAEEWLLDAGKAYIWRNFEEESIFLPKIPYTEYISPIGVTYSKIASGDDFVYSLVREETPVLFQFFDYSIAVRVTEDSQGSSDALNKLKVMDKNSLPKLFLVKILNSNGN